MSDKLKGDKKEQKVSKEEGEVDSNSRFIMDGDGIIIHPKKK